jgi:hypothetical protein
VGDNAAPAGGDYIVACDSAVCQLSPAGAFGSRALLGALDLSHGG